MALGDESGLAVRRMQAQLLRSIRLDIDRLIRPELTSAEARMTAQLASEMLCFLTVGAESPPPDPAGDLATLQSYLDRLAALRLSGTYAPASGSLPATEIDRNDEYSALLNRTTRVLAAALETPPAESAARIEIGHVLREAVAFEGREQRRLHELVTREMTDLADPVAAVETELTAERLDAYLAAKLPDAGRVAELERIPGGYSKDTYRLRVSGAVGGHHQLILRRNLPFGPGENTVVDEHALLNHLSAAGLAVPKPLWLEPDPVPAGTAFLLFPHYAGSAVFGDWHAPQDERIRICRDVARFMARLHQVDPFATGLRRFEPGATPRTIVQAYVRHWRDKWVRRRSHPSLILEIAFDWLERNAPASLESVSIVHGDISFRNTLIESGRLSVLLDWEFWHPGDPMEDLSYFRLVAEPYVDWQVVMDAYQEAGGGAYVSERAAFYEVWRSVRNATTTTTAWHGFLSGAYPASKAAYQGVSLYRLFLRDVADKLSAVDLTP